MPMSGIFGHHVVIIIITVTTYSLFSVVHGLSFQFNASVRRTQIDRGSRQKCRGILLFGVAKEITLVAYNVFFSPNIFSLTKFGTGALGGKDTGTVSLEEGLGGYINLRPET
jgi:hypothetical protein